MSPAPLLVVGVGNPSRGDDAAGPCFVEHIAELLSDDVRQGRLDVLTDFQLQIEHALDLKDRERVVFVDASVQIQEPFSFERISPQRDQRHSSHAMSPRAVLEVHQRIFGPPPDAWCMAIHGQRFELGEPISPATRSALSQALDCFVKWYRTEHGPPEPQVGARFFIRGIVQGVGFRPWVARTAAALRLSGFVQNTSAGVVVEAFGGVSSVHALAAALKQHAPSPALVQHVTQHDLPFVAGGNFVIAASAPATQQDLPLPPDLSLCADCLKDLGDPQSRFAGYAFTSCTACGPRFSITAALPFDRDHTSLSTFRLCPACQAAYDDPMDRRFHAQTLACPTCGPQLWLSDSDGTISPAPDPIAVVVQRLLAGEVLGIMGLGGVHVVCDATANAAVQTLRRRKRRDAKPFAVMVTDLQMAHAYAEIDAESAATLTQPACPIVLLPRRESDLAASVCGSSQRVGLLLPYTPLHQLLLRRLQRPVVMTSGNLSGEPIEITIAGAVQRLGALVDGFLFHNRAILRRVEDSVVQQTASGPQIVRRARGYVPRPIRLPQAAPEPVLAVGGHLKNTVCIVVEDRAYLSPHLGDLETVDSERAWQHEIESLQQLLRVRPNVIVHDLHPDYVSTRYAHARPSRLRFAVQHHMAHALATVAERHLRGPVLGVVLDGGGWGLDGASWGGEILGIDGLHMQRLACLRPILLPGGEAAVRDVWRQALALLFDAFGDEAADIALRVPMLRGIPDATRATVLRMLNTRVQCSTAHGLGRYFDAVGALVLGQSRAQFEAHVAMDLEQLAHGHDLDPYPWQLASALQAPVQIQSAPVHEREGALVSPINPTTDATTDTTTDTATAPTQEIDLRPTTRAVVDDLLRGVTPARIAARFHATVAAATLHAVQRAQGQTGITQVVLTGGALQNRVLQAALRRGLGNAAHMATEIPVNDGGLSLGQAYAAVIALHTKSPHEV
ncbi:MAG: carbamoyltransferase HypF [Myxococcales bacterium]|nr:carbamoyltransferase HypF [Myxococcales bacterium]